MLVSYISTFGNMQTELYGNYIFTYHVPTIVWNYWFQEIIKYVYINLLMALPIYVKSIFFEIEFHVYSFSLGNDI